jgi:hypothetical protein
MQYRQLKQLVVEGTDRDGSKTVTIPADLFRQLLGSALQAKSALDQQFYLATNSDIRAAVEQGRIHGASEHYYSTGYFEDRLPKKLLVDERYYLEQNPDVAEAIREGIIKSAQEHFDYAGFKEGRSPFSDFSLI